ncbi:response regulator [Sphingomonas abietis]|uniref:Response regulator n=1 Tax=Sphingomonas abietis TaxID=3012344 RepID=A0ABY7NTA3_9SPHN|nr:response regulator [Sphingomonas abietis]WBO23878.1 response regulator [Sphingomonas abietis]
MCHVLIIEDEPVVAMDLQMLLEAEGATSIDIAASEAEAIAAARMHRPGFITSDVKLLQGTGPHAVRRIRDEHGDIPVIFITGTPDECEPCDPPDVILQKPFRSDTLASVFRQLAPL